MTNLLTDGFHHSGGYACQPAIGIYVTSLQGKPQRLLHNRGHLRKHNLSCNRRQASRVFSGAWHLLAQLGGWLTQSVRHACD